MENRGVQQQLVDRGLVSAMCTTCTANTAVQCWLMLMTCACVCCTGTEQDILSGRVPQHEPHSSLMSDQINYRFLDVTVETNVGNLPDLDRTVLARTGYDVIVVWTPLDVKHRRAMSRHQRRIAV